MRERYDELRARLGEVHDLKKTAELLLWDESTMMPAGGATMRAEQSATVERAAHEKFVSDTIGELLEELRPYEVELANDSDEAAVIRVARRDYERARRVPADLQAELARAGSTGFHAWREARAQSDFGAFLPHLQHALELRRRYVECFDKTEHPYDVLLDQHEEGVTTSDVRTVFDRLKSELVPLIEGVAGDGEDPFMSGPFPVEGQRQFSLLILERFGFEPSSWRFDDTVHPFAASMGTSDIRLTSRYVENDLNSLFTAMHECGHGLYERGVSPSLERTPACHGASAAFHESQSRLWENLVGRSREFWQHFYSQLQETFPETLGSVELDRFYRAVNRVQPSLIRVDADEVTYNLHIILRFELELGMITGELDLRDLPELWNTKMKEYLGIDVPDDAHGVLQDIHWSGATLGYFPTYALGNVISVQIWEHVLAAIPDLYEQIEQGEFSELGEWLRANVYAHGRKFLPKELLERITGGPIDPDPYLRYLNEKQGELAGVAAG
jgi:carboxypeptidase Taq